MTDFSGAPLTIGEIRANQTGSMRDISPREALIEVLREIDSGKLTLSDVVIVGAKPDDKGMTYRAACPRGGTFALGLLVRAIFSMMEP